MQEKMVDIASQKAAEKTAEEGKREGARLTENIFIIVYYEIQTSKNNHV